MPKRISITKARKMLGKKGPMAVVFILPRTIYAVMDIQSSELLYIGTGLHSAAVAWVTGTVHASGDKVGVALHRVVVLAREIKRKQDATRKEKQRKHRKRV